MPARYKPPGVIRATVIHAAQATVSRVNVRAGVDSGALRATVLNHLAGSEFLPPVPKFLLGDKVVVLDVSFIDYEQGLADEAFAADELGFESGMVFTDSASTLDAVEKDFTKAAADSVAAVDVITTLLTKGLDLADSVTVTDVATALLGGKPELNEMELNTVELN